MKSQAMAAPQRNIPEKQYEEDSDAEDNKTSFFGLGGKSNKDKKSKDGAFGAAFNQESKQAQPSQQNSTGFFGNMFGSIMGKSAPKENVNTSNLNMAQAPQQQQ